MIKTLRNFLIVSGFYGIYHAAFSFVALFWRKAVVYDRVFSGQIGHVMMWISFQFPFWLFCIIAGYCIPYVIESTRKYTWAIVLGGIFTIYNLLFTGVHYAEAPQLFDLTTGFINIIASLILCPLGVYLHCKLKPDKPEPGASQDPGGSLA